MAENKKNNSSFPPSLPWHKRHARAWMGAALFLTDLLGFSLAGFFTVLVRYALENRWHSPTIEMILLGAMLNMLAFGLRGLYPGIGLSPVSELRTLSVTISAVLLGLAGASFFLPGMFTFPRLSLAIFWLLSLILLPVARLAARYLLSRLPAWGEPVILFGGGASTRSLYEHLAKRRMLGFDPVWMGLDGETIPLSLDLPCFELKKILDEPLALQCAGIHTAIITAGSIHEPLRTRLLHLQGSVFQRLIKISDRHELGSLGVSPLDLDGIFALEIRQNLNNARQRFVKRLIDLTLTLSGGLLILPLLLLIGWLVRRNSPGPAIYKQTRIGKNGQPFKAWKFRTMMANAEALLEKALHENPSLLAEWQAAQKLKDDPRITRIGRFLRKYSLDELPQLWNVLRGEMSLVGPRPIVQEEVRRYGNDFDLYTSVLPGLTGLWQVSGRNNTTYAERVRLDAYYVRNWSIWLDIYILLRTVLVVLRRDGAY